VILARIVLDVEARFSWRLSQEGDVRPHHSSSCSSSQLVSQQVPSTESGCFRATAFCGGIPYSPVSSRTELLEGV
jgi:hypothetical protein